MQRKELEVTLGQVAGVLEEEETIRITRYVGKTTVFVGAEREVFDDMREAFVWLGGKVLGRLGGQGG